MGKKGIVTEYLPWLIIGVAVLVILAIAIFVMREKGTAIVDQLKNLFRS
jgi:TM2 domain-containing membrane protein YozV